MATSSDIKAGPEVFINFRGDELRNTFISHLHKRFQKDGINAFIDSDEAPGIELKNLFKRIEDSKIALAVLSTRYSESHWCLQELVKMMECSMKGDECNTNLLVIPIFYKLKISTVAELDGDFGRHLWNLWRLPGRGRDRDNRIVKWNEALNDLLSRKALILPETGYGLVMGIKQYFILKFLRVFNQGVIGRIEMKEEEHASSVIELFLGDIILLSFVKWKYLALEEIARRNYQKNI